MLVQYSTYAPNIKGTVQQVSNWHKGSWKHTRGICLC